MDDVWELCPGKPDWVVGKVVVTMNKESRSSKGLRKFGRLLLSACLPIGSFWCAFYSAEFNDGTLAENVPRAKIVLAFSVRTPA